MLTPEQVKQSVAAEELKLKSVDKLNHYWPSMFLGIVPLTMLFFYLRGVVTEARIGYRPDLIWLVAIASVLSALIYRMQRNRLKFISVITTKQRQELAIIVKKLTLEKEWRQIQLRQDLVVITTHPPFWSGSWGGANHFDIQAWQNLHQQHLRP